MSLLSSLSKYLDDLSGPVATLPDLLNEVATQTNKWEEIGLQLDFSHTDIEHIKIEEQERIEACFIKVFNKWETKLTPPFTWPVIISALESPSVAEFRLASQLKARYYDLIASLFLDCIALTYRKVWLISAHAY